MSSPTAILNISELILRPYRHMLPKAPEGVIFLFSTRFSNFIAITAHNLAMKYHLPAGNVIEELRRLLAIKTFTADEDGTKIMPTNLMDELWVAAIVDTQVYADLQVALGIKLHRRYGVSELASDTEARALRLSTMSCLYRNFFGSEPLCPAYPQLPQSPMFYPQPDVLPQFVILNIRQLTGKIFPLTMARHATISRLKEEIVIREGVAVGQQRLICAGKEPSGELLDGKTLEQYGFVDQNTIYLLHR